MSKITPGRKVLLSNLAAAYAEYTGQPSPKTYAQWWKAIVDGSLPAEKVGDRYWVDLRLAAEMHGQKAAA